jgi:uncharacterized protein
MDYAAIQSINLSRLLREGGTAEARGEITSKIELGNDTILLQDVVSWRVSVTAVGESELWLSGEIAGYAMMECRRCLDPTPTPVRAYFQHMLRYQPGLEHLEAIEEEDEEIFLFGKPDLELSPFLSEAFALEMPYTVLCQEDCPGLCEYCGANLKRAPQNCCPERSQKGREGKLAVHLKKLDLEGIE